MSQIMGLEAEARETLGKGAASALRRAERVPGVVYGGKGEPVHVSLLRKDVIKALNTGTFLSTLFELQVGGDKTRVIPRDVQFHPVNDLPLHIDFLRLEKGATIDVAVPVHFVNEEASPGLKRGGVLNVVRHEVELSCPADSIPEFIELDLTGTEINDSLHISAVTLTEGVSPTIRDRDFTIATIVAPSSLKSEEEEAADEEAAQAAAKAEEAKGEGDAE